jgi:CheY-specific phosphatase CheX/NAD-dependent dihydropyrimidine dehydrogenase PreA subunit
MSLKEKLHKKLQDKQSLRSVGTNPQMTKVKNMMGEKEYEENKDMLFDMQKDIRGSKKSAKKCVKNMMTGMDDNQMDDLSKIMKTKAPDSAKQLTNIIGSKRKTNNEKEKSQSISETTPAQYYIPAAQRPITICETLEPKPKKQFAKIQMSIPKITDLKSIESNKVQKTFAQPYIYETPNRNRDLETLFENPAKYENMSARLKAISGFQSNNASDALQMHVMQNGGRLVKIIKIIEFPKQKYIGLPGSETIVDKPLWNGTDILCQDNYAYKMINEECVRTTNCVSECELFMEKLVPIRNWLSSLENTCVGLESLCDLLNKFGIFQKPNLSDSILVFHVYCKEYPNTMGKILVPQIPFVYIKIKNL